MLCCFGKIIFELGLEGIDRGERVENRGFFRKYKLSFNVVLF